MKKAGAILLAAGSGARMGGQNKMLRDIKGKIVLQRSLEALLACESIGEIAIAVSDATREAAKHLLETLHIEKRCHVLDGGQSRGESVYRALNDNFLADSDIIAIHDAARCLVNPETITATIQSACEKGSGVAGMPSNDSIKLVGSGKKIEQSLDRQKIWRAQTPQTFRADWLKEAYEQGKKDGFCATDDAQLIEKLGYAVYMVEGGQQNIKITTEEDMLSAEIILSQREDNFSRVKTGYGEDIHRFAPDRKLILGGLEIPHEMGLLGHSDADVLCHAISDALLGALGWGDIGQWFPDNDERYRGADSLALLKKIVEAVELHGQRIDWIDACIIAQRPKLSPHIEAMRRKIGESIGLNPAIISIKATTSEGLGFTGREEGIACRAVATVYGPLAEQPLQR